MNLPFGSVRAQLPISIAYYNISINQPINGKYYQLIKYMVNLFQIDTGFKLYARLTAQTAAAKQMQRPKYADAAFEKWA